MNKIFASTLSALLLAGCASTAPVKEALRGDSVSGISMTCKKPYELTQDCSIWSGATRSIEIEGFEVKVAGSQAGDVILIMDASMLTNAMIEGLTLNLAEDYQTVAANNSFVAVKKVLLKNSIKINRARPMVTMGRINGYILELDSDGYSFLKDLTAD